MDAEFRDLYNVELRLLYEQAAEYAEEYPGIAERLGGLTVERVDPAIAGLLEGAAFLAARVQLKLKHEFAEFTTNFLEQIHPGYLAPTPSAMLARVLAPYGDPALRDGRRIAAGAYLEASYRERERRIACRFRLAAPITLWPFELAAAEYFAAPGPIHALGVAAGPEVVAALRLTLTCRTTPVLADEPDDRAALGEPDMLFAGCRIADLPLHLVGPEADAIALYEQVFAHRVGVHFRFLDAFGDPVVIAHDGPVEQLGFGEDEALLPNDNRVFQGFDRLREFFMFPRKFLGFRLGGLAATMPRLKAKTVDVLLTFDEANARLAAAIRREMFALYTAPAVNLFEKTADRIPIKSNLHEYQVVPERSRPLDFEPHRVIDVFAHYPGAREKVPVPALYAAAASSTGAGPAYTIRRLPRRRTAEERRHGAGSDYTGTDLYISLYDPAATDDAEGIAELSVRALCSNRHLAENLPVGEGGADFQFLDDTELAVVCAAGPTRPREPVLAPLRGRSETAHTGAVTWRLINALSLNHLGLVGGTGGRGARALQEMLSLFADLRDSVDERRIRGIRSLDSRPVVRRLRQRTGSGAARGVEVTVTFDEKAFEGSGPFLLGAVLDRFFAEYASLNHFTQCVVRTVERGEIMRWPPRVGARMPL
ncbi:MAG TPA: type VI secretion system baseplate subunit TssF [Hyphomicrobiales bacterium]|nr:type VI secretion system baseplate subunit TssF [Hyphomicrobiales bacterium]